jgi:hypothetical protein
MSPTITALTPEQQEKLPEYRERWRQLAFCTDPANRREAQAAMCEAYTLAGVSPPKAFVWAESALEFTKSIEEIPPLLHNSEVGTRIRLQVLEAAEAAVKAVVAEDVFVAVRSEVRTIAAWAVWDRVRSLISGFYWWLPDGYDEALWNAVMWHQYDYDILATLEYFHDVCGLVDETHRLSGLWRIAKNASWWWGFEDVAYLCERPSYIGFDERFELHRDDGAAVEYRKGRSLYLVHGVHVDERVILSPETITTEWIDRVGNAEQRRVMIQRYGEARYLIDSGAEEVHRDEYGILYRKQLRNDEPLVMVKVLNSTPERDGSRKAYFVRVPPTMHTAHAAVAWTFGMTPEQYQPKFES